MPPRGKGESSEWEGSRAGAASVQVCYSFTRHHYPCLATRPHRLLLPHAVSSLSILQDRGDGGDSQKNIQTMPPSTSATLMVVMTTHLSDGLVRDVHGERHGVATALGAVIRQPPTASDKVLNLFTYSTYVREWYVLLYRYV